MLCLIVLQPGNAVSGGVDKAINLAFSFVSDCFDGRFTVLTMSHQNGSNYFINGATFAPPSLPVLLQIMSGAQAASDLLPSGDVYVLPSNATIELSFPASANAPGAPHPFHLHGVSTCTGSQLFPD